MNNNRRGSRGRGRGVNNYDNNYRPREYHRGGGGGGRHTNGLTGIFTEDWEPVPSSVSNPGDVQLFPRGSAGPSLESRLAQAQEDEDFNYVQEFRNKETKRIAEANKKSQTSTLDQKPVPPHKSHRSRVPEQAEGPIENSIVGTAHASSRPEGEGPLFDDVYDRFDMQSRRFDSSSLAINTIKDTILSAIHTQQSLIVEGFTGCGKTTQVPQFILDDAASKKHYCKIVVTQPRRIAATSVAGRVCKERGWKLGSLVGYQVGLDRQFDEDSRIVYMTTGVLLQTLINKRNLDEWTHVIIDEVHERDLDTDLLMLVLKTIMIKNIDKATKVILMSATLNAEKFKKYFPQWNVGKNEIEAALIKVPHAALYPVKEYYLNTISEIPMPVAYSQEFYDDPKIATEIYEMAVRIIESFDSIEQKNERRGAVLVFLPGLLEIETMYKACVEYTQEKLKENEDCDPFQWQLLPLHSTISKEDQDKVFEPALKDYRKIILATNIAESSITVTDIKYVIDFCLTKSLSCDPNTNYTCLRMEWASKNQCIQRRGRCGRVAPGLCYRMVPQTFFEKLVQEASPEMEKSSLESVVLHAKILNMGKPKALLASAIDPPKLSGIRRAVANLKEVGALTIYETKSMKYYSPDNGELTYLGRIMSKLPTDIRFGRLIAMGHVFGVLEETIIIAAGLSTKSPFSYPYHRRLDAYISKLSWSQSSASDCIAFVHVYRKWIDEIERMEFRDRAFERKWARENLVQLNVMKDIRNLVQEIKRRLSHMMDIRVPDSLHLTANRQLLLKIAIAGAFYPNYFLYSKPKKSDFRRDIAKELLGRNPFTSVVFQGFPQEQPAMLYAEHILQPFEHGNNQGSTVPYIETAGSKILLHFDPRGQKIGLVSHGVYRAVKLRHLRQNISFRIINCDEAYDQVESKLKQLSHKPIRRAPPQTRLPGIQQQELLVRVSFLVSPGEFYITKEEDFPAQQRLEKVLSDLKENNLLRNLRWEDCRKGGLALVSLDDKLYRARIDLMLSRDKGVLVLFLIDVGNLVVKKIQDVFNPVTGLEDPAEIFTTDALAIQCRLKQCKPVTINGGNWQPEEVDEMWNFMSKFDNPLHFQIFSIVEGVMTGDLMDREKSESLINILKSKSLVDDTLETAESEHNYWSLRISSSTARETKEVLDEMSANQGLRNFVPSEITPPVFMEEEVERYAEVTLRGPNSPLEMSFAALCRSSHLKPVLVDGTSVNCVALDNDYMEPCSRLLVAASIGIAHRSGSLMGRETTIMPAIPNLTGLLTLLFCPKMELRLDQENGTSYTGALAGLGVDPINHESIYGDHDVEIMFDTKVDNHDIDMVSAARGNIAFEFCMAINEIRECMNLILRPNNSEALPKLRQKCQDGIMRLLQRPREAMDEVWPAYLHKWGVLEGHQLQSAAPTESELSDVFMIHGKVDFSK